MEWTISPKCNCDAAGHYLEEYAVGLTPTVLMRDRYDSPAIRRSTIRDEMDHVGDLQAGPKMQERPQSDSKLVLAQTGIRARRNVRCKVLPQCRAICRRAFFLR